MEKNVSMQIIMIAASTFTFCGEMRVDVQILTHITDKLVKKRVCDLSFLFPRRGMDSKQKRGIEWDAMPVYCILPIIKANDIESRSYRLPTKMTQFIFLNLFNNIFYPDRAINGALKTYVLKRLTSLFVCVFTIVTTLTCDTIILTNIPYNHYNLRVLKDITVKSEIMTTKYQ